MQYKIFYAFTASPRGHRCYHRPKARGGDSSLSGLTRITGLCLHDKAVKGRRARFNGWIFSDATLLLWV